MAQLKDTTVTGNLTVTGNINNATPTEIGYLNGVTSNIQEQIDVESVISSDGKMAAWKYPDGRITIFGSCVANNANDFVAQAAYNFPVAALNTKPYGISAVRHYIDNSSTFLTVNCAADAVIDGNYITGILVRLYNNNAGLGGLSDSQRTIDFVFNGYWK